MATSANTTSVSNNLVSSSFHFHNFDPKANEEKKRLNREILAKNTFNGMAFKPSKYMASVQHVSNNSQRMSSPSSPVSYSTSRSNSTSNKSVSSTCKSSCSISKQHKTNSSPKGISNNNQSVRKCEKQTTINPTEWNSIKQSIESRHRNVSNCSNSSILSKSSCNIDRNSVNFDYSKCFVNSPSSNTTITTSSHYYSSNYHVSLPLVHNNSSENSTQNRSQCNTYNSSQLSISKTIPLTSSQLLNNVPFTRSIPITHCERLPSIQHLLESIPITNFEKRNNLNSVSISDLLKQ